LCRHGGIAPGEPAETRNEGRFPRSHRLQRVLHRLHAPQWPRGIGRRVMLANLREGPPPPMPPAYGDRLAALVRPELPRLEELLERPLPARWHR
jgi:hypothetical protein